MLLFIFEYNLLILIHLIIDRRRALQSTATYGNVQETVQCLDTDNVHINKETRCYR